MYEFISIVLLLVLSSVFFVRCFSYPVGPQGSLDNRLILFLQEYIRINTSHPKPDYKKALNFLKKNAKADGFAYQEVDLPSGRTVAIITYLGSDITLPALLLNHHMDVVPAENEGWICPPFAGTLHEGSIIGRGTQDMKGIGAVHYGALRKMQLQGIKPRRTIHIVAVPDEEIGGFTGTKEFVESATFSDLHVGFVIDEGHASGNAYALDIKVAERKPIQIEVISKGRASHGSLLQSINPIHQLVEFLHECVVLHSEQQKKIGVVQAGELLSCNITSLTAGAQKEDGSINLNMVPENAAATIDIRVPPTCAKKEIIRFLDNQMSKAPGISYTILAQSDEEPPLIDYEKTKLYISLSKTIAKFNLQTRPHFFEASSDLRFYLARGIEGVGLTPFTVKDTIHGINEAVPVEQLIFGRDIFFTFLKDFCL